MKNAEKPSAPGLADDPILLKALTEIDMIAHMAACEFERLLPEGLTAAQYGVLNRILRRGETESIGELAAAFQVSQPTMSSTVRRLEAKNLIELIPDSEDRRIKRVAVTRMGSSVRKKTVGKLEPYFRELATETAGVDWAQILPVLTQIRAALVRRRG